MFALVLVSISRPGLNEEDHLLAEIPESMGLEELGADLADWLPGYKAKRAPEGIVWISGLMPAPEGAEEAGYPRVEVDFRARARLRELEAEEAGAGDHPADGEEPGKAPPTAPAADAAASSSPAADAAASSSPAADTAAGEEVTASIPRPTDAGAEGGNVTGGAGS